MLNLKALKRKKLRFKNSFKRKVSRQKVKLTRRKFLGASKLMKSFDTLKLEISLVIDEANQHWREDLKSTIV